MIQDRMIFEQIRSDGKIELLDKKIDRHTEQIRKHDSRLQFLDIVAEGLVKDVKRINNLLPTPEDKRIKGFYDSAVWEKKRNKKQSVKEMEFTAENYNCRALQEGRRIRNFVYNAANGKLFLLQEEFVPVETGG